MAKDHGPSVKDDKQYEGLRQKGMSKSRAAAIANTPDASTKGGKHSGSGKSLLLCMKVKGWLSELSCCRWLASLG
jgi:hypothetical protein